MCVLGMRNSQIHRTIWHNYPQRFGVVPVRNWPTGKSSAPARSAGLRKFLRKSLPIQVHPPEGVPGVSWDYGGPSGGKIRANLAGIFPPHGSSQRHLWHELAKPRWLGSIGRSCGCFRGESTGGNTLLHIAAYNGNAKMCESLLMRGACSSTTNRYGEEPWQTAKVAGASRCAKLLKDWPNLDEDLLQDLGIEGKHCNLIEESKALTTVPVAGQLSDKADTTHLLLRVLECAKETVCMQAEGSLSSEGQHKVDMMYQAAHEDFARAYMAERMMLIESLRGTAARDIPTPKNFKEAVNSEFADYWNAAIETEIRNLESFDTWKWVKRPKNRKLVDSTWAFRVKANQQGEVDRMKARLCARGYREIWGQDYVETHASVTCLVSWRVCLAQAAHLGLKVAILDIKSAYLMAHTCSRGYLHVSA